MSQVSTPPAPPAAPPKDDAPARMAEIGEKGLPKPDPGNLNDLAKTIKQRPADVPEKFWDAEKGAVRTDALLKSYTELEKARAGKPPAPTDPAKSGLTVTPDAPPPAGTLPDDATPAQVLEYAGVKQDEAKAAYLQTGKLTDEMYAALKAKGYPRTVVDAYLQHEAQLVAGAQKAEREAAAKLVGGEEKVQAVLEWAKAGLSEQEVQWYNQQTTDPNASLRAFEWLAAKYDRAAGGDKSGKLVTAQPGSGGGAGPYTTQAEYIRDMNDPKFAPTHNGRVNPQYDADFHRRVMQRMALSPMVNELPRG